MNHDQIIILTYKFSFFEWLGRNELMLGNTFAAKQNSKPPNKEVPPKVGLYIQSFNLTVFNYMLFISKLTANIVT